MIPGGLLGSQGGAIGVGTAQGGGMGPQVPHPRQNSQAIPPVGICRIGDVAPDRMTVPC